MAFRDPCQLQPFCDCNFKIPPTPPLHLLLISEESKVNIFTYFISWTYWYASPLHKQNQPTTELPLEIFLVLQKKKRYENKPLLLTGQNRFLLGNLIKSVLITVIWDLMSV